MAGKKVGYYNLDSNLIKLLEEQLATSTMLYDDTALKNQMENFQNTLDNFSSTGSPNSFKKDTDKFTLDMFESELKNAMNQAFNMAAGNDNQDYTNISTTDKINDIKQKIANEISARKSKDLILSLAVQNADITLVTNWESLQEAQEEMLNLSKRGMKGAGNDSDGEKGNAPQPFQDTQDSLLTGNATWTNPKTITVGKAISDKNGKNITSYIKDVSYNKATRELTFIYGDGTSFFISIPNNI